MKYANITNKKMYFSAKQRYLFTIYTKLFIFWEELFLIACVCSFFVVPLLIILL